MLATSLKTRTMTENNEGAPRSGGVMVSATFMTLTVIFCVCLIVSNLMEIKVVDLGVMTVTAGVAVFPVSYIINDCITEIYGFARARMVIWLGFAMNLLVSLLLQVGLALPAAPGLGEVQGAMETVFGAVPRILAASFAAFLVGSMVNAAVMSRMKAVSRARRSDGARSEVRAFSVRAIVSTLGGEGADSLVFFPLAFGGVLDWATIGSLIVTQALLKTCYEIVVLPVTVRLVGYLKRREGLDTVDSRGSVSYGWLPFRR